MIRKNLGKLKITMKILPPSVNHIWKHSGRNGRARTYLTPEGRAFKDLIAGLVPAEHVPFTGSLRVLIELSFPDRRKRDVDNYSKGVLDGLNHRAFRDDSQIVELVLRKKVTPRKEGVQVTIEEVS